MVSKTLASRDAWLDQADEVLRGQHEQSLSPSTAPRWDKGERPPRRIYSRPDPDLSEAKLRASAHAFANQLLSLVSDEVDLIDPVTGPDEEDPELHPDPTADDPPWAEEDDECTYKDE
jgi:hypothetical protein